MDTEALGLRMLEQIRYRGPDRGYLHLEDAVALGVRRLAIVNVHHGPQPTFSGDREVVTILNGEIYNHLALKDELLADGYRVQEGSDAEVIPHAYQKWGLDFPSHFNGDFAIAIWDRRAGQLVLARDRIGIKPLYFTRTRNALLFGSEIKSLFVHPAVNRRLNPRFLAQLYTYWTGIEPQTAFEDVFQVEPASVQVVDRLGQTVASRKYWDIPCRASVTPFRGDFESCQEAFRSELRNSVALRLQADVPVGTYTSGGVDSSVINVVTYGDLQHNETQTFSVAFEDQVFDESEFQRLMVRHIGLKSHEVRCTGDSIYAHLPQVIGHTESPIFRTAPVPMFLLSQCVSNAGMKVVLTGEGSDEVTWGYDVFREAKVRRFWSRQPDSRARPQLFRKLYAYLPQFQNRRHFQLLVDFFRQDMEKIDDPLYSHHMRIANSRATHLFLHPVVQESLKRNPPIEALIASLPENYAERTLLEKCQYLEMRTLLPGYLLSSQGDRMLSAHGVEGRFPFLDHHLIEFLAGVPERYRLRGLRDKFILRETFKNDLPAGIFQRPKFAFRVPELGVFVKDPDGMVHDCLSESSLKDAGIFDPRAVGQFLHRIERTAADRFSTRDNLAFVQMLSTQILHDRFVRQFSQWARPGSRSDVTITRSRLGGLRQRDMRRDDAPRRGAA